jgi:cephalosporin hydroxylase
MKSFNQENITKRSNLEVSDSLSAYLGHSAQQNPYAYEVFFNLIRDLKPSRIIEIGTGMGGFTLFLKMCCDDLGLDTKIVTYDTHGRESYQLLESNNIDVRVKDVFFENYSGIEQELIDLITDDGVCFVLCDGGHKISEFNLLSNYIKVGDIIMAHDYASDEQNFVNNIEYKYWNWLEISDNDIKDAVVSNNLESYKQDEFDKAVWVCKIKR